MNYVVGLGPFVTICKSAETLLSISLCLPGLKHRGDAFRWGSSALELYPIGPWDSLKELQKLRLPQVQSCWGLGEKGHLTFNSNEISYMGSMAQFTGSYPPLHLHVHRHTTSKQAKIVFSGLDKTGLDMNFPNALCTLKSGLMVYYRWLFIFICQWLPKLHIWGFRASYLFTSSFGSHQREWFYYTALLGRHGIQNVVLPCHMRERTTIVKDFPVTWGWTHWGLRTHTLTPFYVNPDMLLLILIRQIKLARRLR